MTDLRSLLIINGPNLNMLGIRDPNHYGTMTLEAIEQHCIAHGKTLGLSISCYQSNHEGNLIDAIQNAREKYDGIIINAGAYTHTSLALLDALQSVDIPTIEVHLSNIHQREEFRHFSYISKAAIGMICGLGFHGYLAAIDTFKRRFDETVNS